jgi:hypothetical protein
MATRKGYGQVEPNHLSAQHNGQIYAQLPAKTGTTKITQLENGQFLKYDYAAGEAHTTGDIEWMLVYNEEKLYDERFQNHKDFAMKASDMTDGTIYPRLFKTHVGDIFTTNAFRTSAGATVAGPNDPITIPDLAVGNYLDIDTAGWLKKATGTDKPASGIVFQVVKVDTMPDGQYGVKIQRIQ